MKQENERILVCTEREDERIHPISFELLRAGREIADRLNGMLCCVLFGNSMEQFLKKMIPYADEVYLLAHPLLEIFDPEVYTVALYHFCQSIHPSMILMGHTMNHQNIAPKLAYRMGTELITDCIQLSIDERTGHLLCRKPVYGAKFIATFKQEKKPFLVTIRPKAWEPILKPTSNAKVIHFTPLFEEIKFREECLKRVKEESIDLSHAEAIVSAGRGVKDVEGLGRLKQLIQTLHRFFNRVELGASRPIVDAHLVPSSRQVGLTGEKVAPALYIAVGISGSMQHVTGILGAKKIVAINTNSKAPIFQVADYGVIGPYEEVLPALAKKLEEL